jgi:putative transposase
LRWFWQLRYGSSAVADRDAHVGDDEAVVKLLWLAIRDIEDKRARERVKQAGRPKNERSAPGKLVEGARVQGWNAAYGAFSLAFPGPLEVNL